MKKIIIALAAIAAAFTMTSCNKEQLVEPEKNTTPTKGNSIITASIESSLTKTSLDGNDPDGYKVVWSDGDTFKIGDNTFTLIEGAGTSTGKFQGTLPEGDGPFYAYYPAEYNGTDWPTTQVYTAGNITGSPMKAEVVKGAESLSFKNVGGILRLSLNGTDQIRRIVVTADGLNDITLECGSGVTLDPVDGKAFHIAMPEGEYEGASISVYNTDFDGCTKKLKEGKTLKIERSKITTASFTVSFPAPAPIASLTGAFSIAEDKQVSFSRGNLYYDDGFKFESRQCNFHGYDYYSKTWGLFGWSTEKTKYGMSTSGENSDYSGYFVDWGKAIGDGETWRTLTSDEWQYLFVTRPNAADKYGYGRVYGTEGLIILPDEFTDPMKNGGSGAFVPGKGNFNSYTLGGNWEAMEAAGAVFLPNAGYRAGSNLYSGSVYGGMYWSSSAPDADNVKAYYISFNSGIFNPAISDGRRFGLSVRLVMDVYTVTFDMNGKTGTAPESLKCIPNGSTVTKPSVPVTNGYEVSGWYKDAACTQAWDFDSDVVTSNITLYANWTRFGEGYAEVKAEAGIPGNKVKWIQLWENGPKFAEFNIGATSITGYGDYFNWADNDIASAHWGSNWRMPKREEFANAPGGLLYECNCKWVSNYDGTGVNGLLCTGKDDYVYNSIFLPAAGSLDSYGTYDLNTNGHYWSSTPDEPGFSYGLYFDSVQLLASAGYIYHTSSVRAVLVEQ